MYCVRVFSQLRSKIWLKSKNDESIEFQNWPNRWKSKSVESINSATPKNLQLHYHKAYRVYCANDFIWTWFCKALYRSVFLNRSVSELFLWDGKLFLFFKIRNWMNKMNNVFFSYTGNCLDYKQVPCTQS